MVHGSLSVIYRRQGVGEVLILMKEVSLGALGGEHLWSVERLAWMHRGRGRYKEGDKLEVHIKGTRCYIVEYEEHSPPGVHRW